MFSGRSGCTDRAGRSFRSGRLCAVHSGMPVLRVAQHHGPLLAQPQRVEKALWRAVSGRGGQSAVLLERAAALYGEQLQLAPRDPYSGGVAGACGTGVFGSAGPGAACPAAGQWQNTVRSRACRICTLPVLAAALCTGFDERPELGRTGCLAGDLCRTGPLLRGRHWRSVRYSLLERGELTKILALCWRNCRKAGNERN